MSRITPSKSRFPDGLPVNGVVLADHVKSADWRHRQAKHIGIAPPETVDQVRAKIKPLLGT
jgi:mRNA interferase MazF